MNKQEIIESIAKNVAGQGNQVDISGKLATILSDSLNLVPDAGTFPAKLSLAEGLAIGDLTSAQVEALNIGDEVIDGSWFTYILFFKNESSATFIGITDDPALYVATFAKADGIWEIQGDEAEYPLAFDDFAGATEELDGGAGLVPAPSAGDNEKFLCGNGEWKSAKIIFDGDALSDSNLIELTEAQMHEAFIADIIKVGNDLYRKNSILSPKFIAGTFTFEPNSETMSACMGGWLLNAQFDENGDSDGHASAVLLFNQVQGDSTLKYFLSLQ